MPREPVIGFLTVHAKNQSPLFVVGCPRSGTSVLYAALNQHPNIALMYECNFWDFPDFFTVPRLQGNWVERLEFYCQSLSRHRVDGGFARPEMEATEAARALYRLFAQRKNAAYYGEKSPSYCARLTQLARRFPDARFILIWRDPVETYRSVLDAGRTSRYFRQRGHLTRLLTAQEEMIRQAAALREAGIPVLHVTYPELVDNTAEACRRICDFLDLVFDRRMLDLRTADFSAVGRGPHQAHLRQGRIQRRLEPAAPMSAATAAKLRRFGARWDRLRQEAFGLGPISAPGTEPGAMELQGSKCAGRMMQALHSAKRAIFEFAPLDWLRAYREIAAKRRARQPAVVPAAAASHALWRHAKTLLLSAALLAGVGWLDYATGTHVSLAPFYFIPCAVVTLAMGWRWGVGSALLSALTWSLLQQPGPGLRMDAVGWWNTLMGFLLLAIPVVLLDRARGSSDEEWETVPLGAAGGEPAEGQTTRGPALTVAPREQEASVALK